MFFIEVVVSFPSFKSVLSRVVVSHDLVRYHVLYWSRGKVSLVINRVCLEVIKTLIISVSTVLGAPDCGSGSGFIFFFYLNFLTKITGFSVNSKLSFLSKSGCRSLWPVQIRVRILYFLLRIQIPNPDMSVSRFNIFKSGRIRIESNMSL